MFETTKVQFLGILVGDDGATVVVVVVVVGAAVVEGEDEGEDGTVVEGEAEGVEAEGVATTSSGVIPVDEDTPLSVEYSKRVTGAPLVLPSIPDIVMSPLLLDAVERTGGVETLPAVIWYVSDA